jgi:hypothetical protein
MGLEQVLVLSTVFAIGTVLYLVHRFGKKKK